MLIGCSIEQFRATSSIVFLLFPELPSFRLTKSRATYLHTLCWEIKLVRNSLVFVVFVLVARCTKSREFWVKRVFTKSTIYSLPCMSFILPFFLSPKPPPPSPAPAVGFETPLCIAYPQTSFGVRLPRIHFSPRNEYVTNEPRRTSAGRLPCARIAPNSLSFFFYVDGLQTSSVVGNANIAEDSGKTQLVIVTYTIIPFNCSI